MKIGFIGTGNMGSALIEGYIGNDSSRGRYIYAYDKDERKREILIEKYGLNMCESSKQVVEESDIIILAVKPNIYGYVLEEISSKVTEEKIIVSIAAGVSIKYMESFFNQDIKIVRTMPNTPALVGEGMTAITKNRNINESDLKNIIDIFNLVGVTEIIEEDKMEVATGISGSSPAYVYMFIEALADGAVLNGLSREQAYKFAAQAVMGAAKMVKESDMHPGELKDMVCSPGGTTIEAVRSLEESGFRSAVIKAVDVCTDKAKKMGK